VGGVDAALALQQRPHRREHGVRALVRGPEIFQTFLFQEHSGEIRLRIEVRSQHAFALVCKHPRQVIDQRSLADAALVVEEGDGGHPADLTVTPT